MTTADSQLELTCKHAKLCLTVTQTLLPPNLLSVVRILYDLKAHTPPRQWEEMERKRLAAIDCNFVGSAQFLMRRVFGEGRQSILVGIANRKSLEPVAVGGRPLDSLSLSDLGRVRPSPLAASQFYRKAQLLLSNDPDWIPCNAIVEAMLHSLEGKLGYCRVCDIVFDRPIALLLHLATAPAHFRPPIEETTLECYESMDLTRKTILGDPAVLPFLKQLHQDLTKRNPTASLLRFKCKADAMGAWAAAKDAEDSYFETFSFARDEEELPTLDEVFSHAYEVTACEMCKKQWRMFGPLVKATFPPMAMKRMVLRAFYMHPGAALMVELRKRGVLENALPLKKPLKVKGTPLENLNPDEWVRCRPSRGFLQRLKLLDPLSNLILEQYADMATCIEKQVDVDKLIQVFVQVPDENMQKHVEDCEALFHARYPRELLEEFMQECRSVRDVILVCWTCKLTFTCRAHLIHHTAHKDHHIRLRALFENTPPASCGHAGSKKTALYNEWVRQMIVTRMLTLVRHLDPTRAYAYAGGEKEKWFPASERARMFPDWEEDEPRHPLEEGSESESEEEDDEDEGEEGKKEEKKEEKAKGDDKRKVEGEWKRVCEAANAIRRKMVEDSPFYLSEKESVRMVKKADIAHCSGGVITGGISEIMMSSMDGALKELQKTMEKGRIGSQWRGFISVAQHAFSRILESGEQVGDGNTWVMEPSGEDMKRMEEATSYLKKKEQTGGGGEAAAVKESLASEEETVSEGAHSRKRKWGDVQKANEAQIDEMEEYRKAVEAAEHLKAKAFASAMGMNEEDEEKRRLAEAAFDALLEKELPPGEERAATKREWKHVGALMNRLGEMFEDALHDMACGDSYAMEALEKMILRLNDFKAMTSEEVRAMRERELESTKKDIEERKTRDAVQRAKARALERSKCTEKEWLLKLKEELTEVMMAITRTKMRELGFICTEDRELMQNDIRIMMDSDRMSELMPLIEAVGEDDEMKAFCHRPELQDWAELVMSEMESGFAATRAVLDSIWRRREAQLREVAREMEKGTKKEDAEMADIVRTWSEAADRMRREGRREMERMEEERKKEKREEERRKKERSEEEKKERERREEEERKERERKEEEKRRKNKEKRMKKREEEKKKKREEEEERKKKEEEREERRRKREEEERKKREEEEEARRKEEEKREEERMKKEEERKKKEEEERKKIEEEKREEEERMKRAEEARKKNEEEDEEKRRKKEEEERKRREEEDRKKREEERKVKEGTKVMDVNNNEAVAAETGACPPQEWWEQREREERRLYQAVFERAKVWKREHTAGPMIMEGADRKTPMWTAMVINFENTLQMLYKYQERHFCQL